MDNIVEENGNTSLDPLNDTSGQQTVNDGSAQQNSTQPNTGLTTTANIVQFLPQSIQAQSVIQANQSSVIHTATNAHPVALPKGVVYLNKQNTVIHTTGGNTMQVQIKPEPNTTQTHMIDTNSDESLSDDDSPKRRRELTRRPSYHKILKEISGPDIAATTLQIANMNSGESGGGHAISAPGCGGTTVFQITTPGQEATFYVPALGPTPEDQTRKREIRLQKNREAARECRRKKKEYIKCLENRVAVLENQNKALIEELKALKELYCQQKND